MKQEQNLRNRSLLILGEKHNTVSSQGTTNEDLVPRIERKNQAPITCIRLISETTQEKKEHKLKSLLNRIVVKRKRLASKQGFNDNSTLYKE